MKSYKKLAIGIVVLFALSAPVFAACETTPSVSVDGGNHVLDGEPKWNWDDEPGDTPCSAVFTCALCGEEITKPPIVTASSNEATCTEPGTITYSASVRGSGINDWYKESKTYVTEPALGHKYDESDETSVLWVWTNASGEETATLSLKCTRCGDECSPKVTLKKDETKPTVSEDGGITYTATAKSEDGQSFEDTTYVPYVHTYSLPTDEGLAQNWQKTDSGYILSFSVQCTDENCPRVLTYNLQASYDKNSSTVSCTSSGTMVYTASCEIGGETVTYTHTENSDALGHDYGSEIAKKDPTCYSTGVAAHYECSRCHDLFVLENGNYEQTSEDDLVLETIDHIYGEDKDTVEASYDTEGGYIGTCTMCKECVFTKTEDKKSAAVTYDSDTCIGTTGEITLNPYTGTVYYMGTLPENGDIDDLTKLTPVYHGQKTDYYSYNGKLMSKELLLEEYSNDIYTSDEEIFGDHVEMSFTLKGMGYYTFDVSKSSGYQGTFFVDIYVSNDSSVQTVGVGDVGDALSDATNWTESAKKFYRGTVSSGSKQKFAIYTETYGIEPVSFTFSISYEYVKLGTIDGPVEFDNHDYFGSSTYDQLSLGVYTSVPYTATLLPNGTTQEKEDATDYLNKMYFTLSRTSGSTSTCQFCFTYLFVTTGVQLYYVADDGTETLVTQNTSLPIYLYIEKTLDEETGEYTCNYVTNKAVKLKDKDDETNITTAYFDVYIVPLYVSNPIKFSIKNTTEENITLQLFTVDQCITEKNMIEEADHEYTFELNQDVLTYGYLLKFYNSIVGDIVLSATDADGNELEVYMVDKSMNPIYKVTTDYSKNGEETNGWYMYIRSDAEFEGTITVHLTIKSST